jgi:hypothetical protein
MRFVRLRYTIAVGGLQLNLHWPKVWSILLCEFCTWVYYIVLVVEENSSHYTFTFIVADFNVDINKFVNVYCIKKKIVWLEFM